MREPTSDIKPQPIYRKDYQQPDWWIDGVELQFDLFEHETLVRAKLALRKNAGAPKDAPLVLHGEKLELRAIAAGGRALRADEYTVEPHALRVTGLPDRCELSTTVAIKPQENTGLMGLYKSGRMFCTQCEAEGFRKITWFLDRPDVMARYTVRIEADAKLYPVLLSNGNRVEQGEAANGRHWVRWEDPFPKPSYLFALVAGDLRCHKGTYKTMSGRTVACEIWVEPENIDKCEHALRSLHKAMQWDEQTFGREYDLDLYMIVAVNDFNMGAMENKGLNVFNSKYVLASPATATDTDYEMIEGVIAHEYFHNWTGNRVTCRDWFQLTLKEGLTVFRDQQFSMDMQSAAVVRIDDVKNLRATQFPEDAGPMAHPVRPESYIEMNNFYTATVYVKGAEVVRMYQALLGRDGFRRGMDLYFERHDGKAVTCDDFRAAMADANREDLQQFERWYLQAGTPTITAQGSFDDKKQEYRLTLRQEFPQLAGHPAPQPALVPVAVGLLGPDGGDLPLRLAGERTGQATTRVLRLKEAEQQFTFTGITRPPVPSLLRGFSVPAKLRIERSRDELAFLLAHDSDGFARWDAGQELAQTVLLDLVAAARDGKPLRLDPLLVEALTQVVEDDRIDGSYKALLLTLPEERVLIQALPVWDPDAVHAAREFVLGELARALEPRWRDIYDALSREAAYAIDRASIDRRRLKNTALQYLTQRGEPAMLELAKRQLDRADNMTDAFAALGCLVDTQCAERGPALQSFHAKWQRDPLVLDKWFTLQATSKLEDTPAQVRALTRHADFTLKNPNRVRSLIGAFGMLNQARFHAKDGQGYQLLADVVLELDSLNPQVASRMVSCFNQWKKFDPARQALMRAQLERVAAKPALSKDVFEVVGRALGR